MRIELKKRFAEAGTLLEVLVAVSIVAVMGAGLVQSINYGVLVMRLTRENARATQIMLEKLESIRLYNWAEVTAPGYVPANFTDVYDPQAPAGQQYPIYYGSMAVTNCPVTASYSTNMKQFTVTLRWTTSDRIPHVRSVTTYVAQDGMQNYVY